MTHLHFKLHKLFAVIFTVISASTAHAQETAGTAATAEAAVQGVQEAAAAQFQTARKLLDMVIEFVVKYSFQFLGGVIVLVLGWLVAKYICGLVEKFLQKKDFDVTVSKFMLGGIKILIMSFAVIVALGKFGIEIAPLIAGISIAGVGIGLALQAPLSNFAAGATLIFTKLFKVGEIVEVAGVNGVVTDMKLARTELRTIDGTLIVVPNKHIIGEVIQNFSTAKKLDINIGVSYSSDVNRAVDLVTQVIKNTEGVLKEANVGISEFADSSINLHARVWCEPGQYWDVLYRINKNIFDEFNKNGIEIPFPQRDVHVISQTADKASISG